MKLLPLIFLLLVLGCNTKKQTVNMNENREEKYAIYKGLYWNHPVSVCECNREEIANKHLILERKMLQKPGTLNFLANENILKHKELVSYLKNNLAEEIDFKLNGEPFILADYELRNTLSNKNVKDILDITGFGVYKIIKLDKAYAGKYILVISEDYSFENESGNLENYIFSNQFEAEVGLTKYLINQLSNHSASFAKIKEDESKTVRFKTFIDGLNYFDFFDGYLIIQPIKELIQNLGSFSDAELMKVKLELDSILNYTNSDVYNIIEI